MRTLVTGAGGMLARATLPLLDPETTSSTERHLCDIVHADAIGRCVMEAWPERILHFAAYTAVDKAESDPDVAFAVNARGSENVARAAAGVGAQLVLVSTDYVFDGSLRRPLREEDPVGPASVYGRTKLEGERRAMGAWERTLVVRTAWLFGDGGPNFVDTIAKRLASGEAVSVVDDQVGRPTWTHDLAPAILQLSDIADSGIFHLTNTGEPVSWFEVARHIARCLGADPELVSPTTTKALGRPAPRPAYSVLDTSKAAALGVGPLEDWRDAVASHLAKRRAR